MAVYGLNFSLSPLEVINCPRKAKLVAFNSLIIAASKDYCEPFYSSEVTRGRAGNGNFENNSDSRFTRKKKLSKNYKQDEQTKEVSNIY